MHMVRVAKRTLVSQGFRLLLLSAGLHCYISSALNGFKGGGCLSLCFHFRASLLALSFLLYPSSAIATSTYWILPVPLVIIIVIV